MAFTAWGLAGFVTWTLHTMLAGGVATLLLAVMPLPGRLNGSDGEHGNWQNLKRLLCCPGFWCGAAFLIYITIQAFNPAAIVLSDERGWWVQAMKTPFGTWLPTGVRSDYEPMNAFRVLVSFSAAFSLAFGLWVGIRRRKAAVLVLWIFILSGSGMAVVAIMQHLSGAKEVLWSVRSSNPEFWGTFFYRNHAAAYLNLILIACGFLYFYHAKRSKLMGRSGGPHLLLFVLFALTSASVCYALSRGGILFAGFLAVIFIVGIFIQHFVHAFEFGHSWWLTFLGILALLVAGYSMVRYVDLDAIEARFGDIEATIENAELDPRAISSRATWDMAQARWVTGWGAGSFRYIFPMYQKNYRPIFFATDDHRGGRGRRIYRYAHNDIAQFFAEYGAVGCGFLVLLLAAFLGRILWDGSENVFSVIMILFGLTTVIAHAFLDFILNCPAYWVAFVAFLAMGAKLVNLSAQRSA